MPAADNITSINSIHDMIAGPMISQGDVTGLIVTAFFLYLCNLFVFLLNHSVKCG